MSGKLKFLFIIFAILLTAGCSHTDVPSEQAAIPPLTIQITPVLTHWIPEINACIEQIPDAAVIVDILPYEYLDHEKADLIIRLGKKESKDQTLSILGYETIDFIINSQNPLTEVSPQSLLGILEGSLTNWNQLPEYKTNGLTFDQEIILLSYGESNDLNRIVTNAFLENNTITKGAWYIASWETMLGDIVKTPGTIGYVLESQISGSIISLEIFEDNLLNESLEQPVLAITQSEPGGSLLQLLLCIQGAD